MNIIKFIMIFGLTTCFTQVSFATALNIDFGSEYTGLPSSYGAASSQIGHWNDISSFAGLPTTTSLLNTAGIAAGVDLTLSNTTGGGILGATDNDTALLYDNFFTPISSPWSVSLSGIEQGMYDIYYYAPSHSSISTGVFSINGTNVLSLTGSLSLIQGTSWDVLSGVSIDSSGLLFIQLESNASLLGLSGLQIVPVPVPAAVWLFGSSLIGLIGMRKNTSKATRRKV